ncbi:MAG: hypothetical protein ABI782_08000 [Anaerolineaceae bacterium]
MNDSEREQATRPMVVMPDGGVGVVYVDHDASTATITAALEAWGLHVRAEREHGEAATKGLSTDDSWATARPLPRPLSRLENLRSPVWLPAVALSAVGPPTDPLNAWFMRAA